MSVIKEEYLSEKITRYDLLPLSFLKKSVYTGSKRGLRFRMEKTEEGLLCSTWPEPYAFSETEEQLIHKKEFAFSEEGIEEALSWMNGELSALCG